MRRLAFAMATAVIVLASRAAAAQVVTDATPHDAVPAAYVCFDSTDIVGVRECPHYAAWGDNLRDAYFVVENGLDWRVYPDINAAPTPAVARTTSGSGITTRRRHDHSLLLDERFVRPLDSALYAAIEFEFGNLLMGSLPRDLDTDALASIGLRASLGPAAAAVELSGGGRLYTYAGQTAMHSEGVLEVHARASVWLGPWVTVGPMIGTSIVTSGEWVVGGFIAFHSRTYAGER